MNIASCKTPKPLSLRIPVNKLDDDELVCLLGNDIGGRYQRNIIISLSLFKPVHRLDIFLIPFSTKAGYTGTQSNSI